MDKKTFALLLVIGITVGNTARGSTHSTIDQLSTQVKTLETITRSKESTLSPNYKQRKITKGSKEYYQKIDNLIDSINTLIETETAKNLPNKTSLWQIGLSLGYNSYRDSIIIDGGNTPAVRFSLGFNPVQWKYLSLGLEAGIQNGNQMNFSIPTQGSGTPSDAANITIKPAADILGTIQLFLNGSKTVSISLKGGIACRHLQFDTKMANGKTQYSGTLQAGIGIKFSSSTRLIAYYQGIYSGPVKFGVDKDNTYTGNIPTQHGGFLGVEIAL